MERIYKQIIAIVCTIALVVSTLSIQPSTVSAATVLADNTWITVGSWDLLAGTWAGATASYEGDGNSFEDMTLTISSPVTSPDEGDNKWGIQMGYTVPDLVDGVTYDYTMVINSTTEGSLFTQMPGVETSLDILISAGDNTIKGTFTAGANPAKGNIMIFPYKLPENTVLKMVSLTISEHAGEVTTEGSDADGFTPLGSGDVSKAPFGVWGEIFQAATWGNAQISIKGAGVSFDDLAIKVVSSNGNAGCWAIQAKYPVSGLDASKTYNYTIKYNASQAGTMYLKLEGYDVGKELPAVAGENTITETFSGVSNFVAVFELSGMPAGTVIDFNSFEYMEQEDDVPTTTPSGETEWVELTEETPGIAEGVKYFYDKTNMTISGITNIQQPAWSAQKGIYMDVPAGISAVSVNGVTENVATIQGAGTVVYLSALTQDINEVIITHANGTSKVTIKRESSGEVETTTPQPTTPSSEDIDPSIITDWIAVNGSTTLSYYNANNKVTEGKIEEENLYIAYGLSAPFQSVTLDGNALTVSDGAYTRIPTGSFTEGYHKLVVVNYDGTESATVYIKADKEPETTTPEPTTAPEIVDGTELLKDTAFEEGNVSHWDEYGPTKYTNQGNGQLDVQIPAYDSGDNWATQLVQKNLQLYEGKWYVAEFTITSDVDKSFQLLIQSDGNNGGDWTVFAEEIVSVAAGETKKVQVQFQATKDTAVNVLYGIMMGYVNGTASAAANVTIKDVSLKVYNGEQQISGSQTVLLTSDDVSVSGFQMKTNWPDEDMERNEIGFRTVCKAPNVGGKVAVGNITYTVARIGTLYTIEPDKNIPEGVSFTASGTLLKSYDLATNNAETVNPFTLAVTATEENGIMEKDDTYSSYVQTLIGTIGQLHPGNKIHVRPFVVTTGGTIIYGKKSVNTSMARVAAYMYQQSLASNYRGHEYLYEKILNVETFVPTQNTDYITTKANPFYRNTTVVYGWNDNLYTPDKEHYMNLKPDVYLGNDYITATTGWDDDPASVNTNTKGGVISIAGMKFDYGIATNAPGYFEYNVPKNATYFVGIVGVDDSVKTNTDYVNGATITCEVAFDGSIATTTKTIGCGDLEYIKVKVPDGASKITIKFGDAGDGSTCDRASMANAGWIIDESINAEDETTAYDTGKDPSDITRIYVFTDDTNAKITKETKTPGSITIISGENTINSVSDTGTIKLRGNSTALADKPAYNISFSSKQKVFANAETGKKWCLLANAYDKTMLRNKLALDLGKTLGNVATPESHYADLYLNGKLMGTYLISEPADNGRSGIEYDDTDDSELMFEWETEKTESGQTYYITDVLNVRFVVNDPEGLDTTTVKYNNWVNTLRTFETALQNTTDDTALSYIDVDSFVDTYIVNELFKTVDFGYSSVKFYTKKNADGNPIIYAGCLWDFDLSSGNSSVAECRTTEEFRGQNVNKWFGLLMSNDTFKNKVIAKYKEMQPTIQNIYQDNDLGTNQIDKLLSYMAASKDRNYSTTGEGGAGWSESQPDSAEVHFYPYGYNTLSPYNTYTYEQHVAYLRSWLKARNEWICSQWDIS